MTREVQQTALIPVRKQELTVIQNPTPQQGPTAQAQQFGQQTSQQISTVQPPDPLPGQVWAHYDVVGAPLTLDFDKVFLLNPIPPQQNFIFNDLDLAACARTIWEY
jgi:hypothetical protein